MQDIPPLFNHSDDTNVNFQLQFRSVFSHSFFLTVNGVYKLYTATKLEQNV